MATDFATLWQEALPWSAFFAPDMDQRSLWEGVYRHVVLPPWAAPAAATIPGLKFLVIMEDWCGDAANIIPVVVRLTEAVPGLALRILPRDQYPELMDRYLTNGSRSIPIVIALDSEFREIGHWGPRPAELQKWVLANKDMLTQSARYIGIRRWFAIDKGVSILREILTMAGIAVPEL